ncbi:hypothetical protein [Brevibacillus borstelensis]|uniref:hypothetical protein n=1 Tax=Brevibacillus borstelensis TaxID=45462 RepID=UPI0030C2515E
MQAITFYVKQQGDETSYEYNIYDNKFSPSNLAVRKVLMAMLESVHQRLTHLEIEYNDQMLADSWGAKRSAEWLLSLGASRENMRENRSGDVIVSRQFRAPMTPERYHFFYTLNDVSAFPHYRLQEGEADRIVFYFSRYLQLVAPHEEAEAFLSQLEEFQLPYKIVRLD